ncbi:MAG: hypothetical protein SFU98_13140 [Leptospiraceae bacterium]|nr:hypothetical protein [Leptospiraceae bacterium]
MKFSIFILLISFTSTFCSKNDKLIEYEKEIPIENKNVKLYPKFLNGEWVPEYNVLGWRIKFFKNGKYEEVFAGEGCGGYTGKYFILSEKIKLIPDKKVDCLNEQRIKNNECILQNDFDSLYSTLKLVCNDEVFYSKENERKDGEVLNINSIKAVSVFPKNYYTNAVIYFREGPGTEFNSISCSFESAGEPVNRKTIPDGTFVLVIARTIDKYKVGNLNNYWYFVEPYTGWYSYGCEKKFGWVYGEYIKKAEN